MDDRHDDGIMCGCLEHHTHDATATDHSHLCIHPVGLSPVDGEKIGRLVERATHHLCLHHLILRERMEHRTLLCGRVVGGIGIKPGELVDLTLEIEITQGQLFVDLA